MEKTYNVITIVYQVVMIMLCQHYGQNAEYYICEIIINLMCYIFAIKATCLSSIKHFLEKSIHHQEPKQKIIENHFWV